MCVVCGVVGALMPKENRAPTSTTTSSSSTPTNTAQPANPPSGRVYVTETCAQVAHTFGAQANLSDLQQEELWRQYDDKWVRWRVKVGDVSETLGQLQMQFQCSRESLLADGFAHFDDSQRARLLAVRPGTTVEIEGRLDDHGRVLGLSLADATIVSP